MVQGSLLLYFFVITACSLSGLIAAAEIDCGPAPEVPNSETTISTEDTALSTATYRCTKGHILYGNSTISCDQNGTWSEPPICHKIRCAEPPLMENGQRFVNGRYFNDTVVYECDMGYSIAGNSTIYCQFNGNWSTVPECQGISAAGSTTESSWNANKEWKRGGLIAAGALLSLLVIIPVGIYSNYRGRRAIWKSLTSDHAIPLASIKDGEFDYDDV